MRIATRISFVVMVPVLIMGALEASHFPRAHDRVARAAAIAAVPSADRGWSVRPSSAADDEDPMDQGTVDLYGNETTDAVARYKLDADGSLYELHSPQTELPRLGSPKS